MAMPTPHSDDPAADGAEYDYDYDYDYEAAEARLQARLAEVEKAHAEGRLWDVIKDVPSVQEQYRRVKEHLNSLRHTS